MYSSGVRIIIWMCAIFYLLQHLYFPITHEMFGMAYLGHPNFNVIQFLTYGFLHGDAVLVLSSAEIHSEVVEIRAWLQGVSILAVEAPLKFTEDPACGVSFRYLSRSLSVWKAWCGC